MSPKRSSPKRRRRRPVTTPTSPRRPATKSSPRKPATPDARLGVVAAPPPQDQQPVASPGGSVPRFIGLTGSVAAGKSEALAAFERLGAATLSSDAITHELLGTSEVRGRLVDRWGERVVRDGD